MVSNKKKFEILKNNLNPVFFQMLENFDDFLADIFFRVSESCLGSGLSESGVGVGGVVGVGASVLLRRRRWRVGVVSNDIEHLVEKNRKGWEEKFWSWTKVEDWLNSSSWDGAVVEFLKALSF